jgi:ADP-dependent phosphofructokinase/glucokinase
MILTAALSDQDEVHLITEYTTGEEWGGHKTPRSNRFIVSNDYTNSQLKTLEAFHQSITRYLYQPSTKLIPLSFNLPLVFLLFITLLAELNAQLRP